MATETYPRINLDNNSWTDLTVATGAFASVTVHIQNVSRNPIRVFFKAAAGAPSAGEGMLMWPGDLYEGSAAHIWCCPDGIEAEPTSQIVVSTV